jgi:hypothetical protein
MMRCKARRLFVGMAATWVVLTHGAAMAQLSMPVGTVFTEHGTYSWVAPGPASPAFNIPGNGWMTAPGGFMPQVVAGTALSSSGAGGMGPWLTWTTGPAGFFGGASTTLRGFSNGASAGLQWADYRVFDNTPVGVPAGSYNVSGGDIAGTVGPAGWAGRSGLYFPFQVRATKPIGYAALGAAFEIEIYNAGGVLQRMYDIGAIARTDGAGPGVDGIDAFHVNIFNSPGAIAAGAWRQFHIGPVYYFQGWVSVVTPVIAMGPGWSWVVQGRLTLLADPDFQFDIFDPAWDPLLTQPTANDLPDLGYKVPTPGAALALLSGLLVAANRRRR